MESCPTCKSTDRIPYEIRQEHMHGKKKCDRGLKCGQKVLLCLRCRIAR